jgi:ubiquinone/menaquinone biosynthesis C-methylase UbiE
MEKYVHGYTDKETSRLNDQAKTLEDLLHSDTLFNQGDQVLEAGCGVGAQTVIVSKLNPGIQFTAIDISPESLRKAKALIDSSGITNVKFLPADIQRLPFADETFDHILVCFVLEHLSSPLNALIELKRVLKRKGKIIVIEGDHGSAYFHPDSLEAQMAINSQIEIQKRRGGDANIGRRLYPMLNDAAFNKVSVKPLMVYADASNPSMVEGFIKKTFTAMVEGVRKDVIGERIINESTFDKGIQDLYRTALRDGVFCYTFFKGTGIKN